MKTFEEIMQAGRITLDMNKLYFCTYSCMRAWDKEKGI